MDTGNNGRPEVSADVETRQLRCCDRSRAVSSSLGRFDQGTQSCNAP